MIKLKKSLFINEKGATLIEVLASIVILTIILTSVLTVFLQSLKATETSSDTIEATYIAQTEMEKMYELSRNIMLEDLKDEYEKKSEDNQYKITIKIKEEENSLINVIVKVYEKDQSLKPLVQMENLFDWKVDTDE